MFIFTVIVRLELDELDSSYDNYVGIVLAQEDLFALL